MQLDYNALVTGLIGLVGAIIGGVITIVVTHLKEHYEDKIKRRELIVKSAIEDWSKHFELLKKQGGELMPLDNYVSHYILVLEAVLDKKFDPEKLKEALKKSAEVTKCYSKHDKDTRSRLKAT